MGVTISTHNGSAYRHDHNIRNPKVTEKEAHIDPNGKYEIWHDERVRTAYERLFGPAVDEYNAKQTRKDRKIENYYNEVCKDAKKHPVYEMIIGIYGMREDGTTICTEQTGYDIMKSFVDGWKERNPNLELIGAYYHADEQGEPHVHIDYVPVAHGYTKGLSTQNGLVKALGEMGFEKQGRATAQIQWEARENKHLDELCRAHGLEVDHPREENRKHVETETFKAQQELSRTIDHYNDMDRLTVQKEHRAEHLKGEIRHLKGEYRELKDLQKEVAGKDILGRPRDYVKMDYEEYVDLQYRARAIDNVQEAEAEARKLREQAQKMQKEAQGKLAEAEAMENNARHIFNEAIETRKKAEAYLKQQKEYILGTAKKMAQEFMKNALQGLGANVMVRMKNYMNELKLTNGKTAMQDFEEREAFLDRQLRETYEKYGWEVPNSNPFEQKEQTRSQDDGRTL